MQVTIPYTPRKAQAYIHEQLDKFRYSLLYSVVIEGLAKLFCVLII